MEALAFGEQRPILDERPAVERLSCSVVAEPAPEAVRAAEGSHYTD